MSDTTDDLLGHAAGGEYDDGLDEPAAGEPKGKVRFGHAGRYELPDPVTGKIQLWTRVSTIAHTLGDTFHLDQWEKRMVAKGMGLRPDLAALAASLDVTEDKKQLQEIASTAKESAGGSVGANLGTALHAYAERLDGGEDMSRVAMTVSTRRDLTSYQRACQERQLTMYPELMERVVINHELGVCGRLDRIGTSPLWPLPRILDLKSQKTMDFGALEQAIQLSMYANADYMWNENTAEWEPFPEMDKRLALVMHVPVGKGECTFHRVDIQAGWDAVKLAMAVRDIRKQGKKFVTPEPADMKYRLRIAAAITVEDLSAVWQDAKRERMWNKTLEQLGMAKRAQILETAS